ncbi:hypothetical protein [Neobacillus sp. Marseille-QA0830]
MSICPVCNGMREVYVLCPDCGQPMLESGREMDYYDDYSAYMEIDLMKMEDGYPESKTGHKCPHLFRCPSCLKDETIFINE